MVLTSGNRMGRISTWLAGACADPNGTGFQTCHGLYALADGGWWGVGLGASREKWQWLPEAHNDFIFSIIGEELGLPGTFVVMGLFAALAFACYRLVSRTDDFFIRVASAGVMVWILVQAIINIGVGHRRPAGHRGAVAAGVSRRLGPGHHALRPGHADLLRPQRARLLRGAVHPTSAWCRRSLAVLPARRRRSAWMSTGPSSVLLAGGGSAGHVSPLLALADCLRRSDPDVRITALGTETGLEQRLVPARGYPLRTIPKVAVPAAPLDRPGPAAGLHARAPSSRPVRPSTRPAPRSSSASAATSRPPPTSPPGAGASRSSCTSRTPVRAWPTGWAPA